MIRNTKYFTIFILLVFTLSSCGNNSGNIPQRLDSFVDKTELKCNEYSDEEWENSIQKFEELVDSYQSNQSKYSESEKQTVRKAIGRYYALALKRNVQESVSILKEITESLPDFLEGFANGLEENHGGDYSISTEKEIDELLNSLDELFSGSSIE